MTGARIKSLIERARSIHLVRVVGVYIIAAWAILQAVDLFVSQFGLPGWFFQASLVLLLIGLPVVAATALVQIAADRRAEEAARQAEGAKESGEEAPVEPPRWVERLLTWRFAILGGVAAFLVLGSIGVTLVWLRVRDSDVRPDTVAVMPFHVVGNGVELWREGMIDLMATALDATGEFHSADPRAVLNRWRRRAENPDDLPEPEIAAEVAGSLGAGRAIIGSLIQTAPGSVRLSADLYSVKWRRKDGSAVVEGSEDQMTSLVDRLTIELLRSVWEGDAMPDVRVTALTTPSIPALRAYLEGEQLYRRSQFRDAQAAFSRAVEYDSTFAIAHYRLAQTYGWFVGLGADQVPEHLAAAERHSQGLPPRDSLLIRGWKLADVDGSLDAIPLFRDLVERYPDDLEAWHGLGDAIYHMGAQLGYPIDAAVEPLERTLALDSTFAPALIHLIEISYATGDSARGRDWTARYLEIDSTSQYARSFGILTPLHFGTAADSSRAAAALDTAGLDLLMWSLARIQGSGTPLPLYQKVALAAVEPRFPEYDSHMALWNLGLRHIRYGQMGVGLDLLEESMSRAPGMMERGMLNIVATGRELDLLPEPETDSLFNALRASVGPESAPLAVDAARESRPKEVQAVLNYMESAADSLLATGDSTTARSVRGSLWTLRGRIAAVHDSIDPAIGHLRRGLPMINATWSWDRDIARYWLANLIQDRGGEQEAISIYGSLYLSPWLEALGYFHRAELHDRLGEADEAARYYARFLELWGDADPHLQPRVEAARRALERLRGERLTS